MPEEGEEPLVMVQQLMAEWLSYSYGSSRPYDGLCTRVLRPQRGLLVVVQLGTEWRQGTVRLHL